MSRLPFDMPPGVVTEDSAPAASGRWADASNVRFWQGRPQVIGGWEALIQSPLGGVCRGVHSWTNKAGLLNVAFGTHATLELWLDGFLHNITPAGLAVGEVDGTGGAGFGTGAFGVGAWSEPAATDYYARTWSLANFGELLMACPRGGTIYEWANNTANKAVPLTNAPARVTQILVTPKEQVMALGCNEEVSGAFNPVCIRYSGVRKRAEWNTAADTTAREEILPGGGEIVGGRVMGDYVLVWTRDALFIGTFSANLAKPWAFKRVASGCGLAGPNAAVVVGLVAYWLGPDLQFRAYSLGGQPVIIPSPVRTDMASHLAASQADKVVASSCSIFNEVRFDYPDDRDGYENSRYLLYAVAEDCWSRGLMARTFMLDGGVAASPIGVTADGAIYWQERGTSADGQPLAWFIETADTEIDPRRAMMARKFIPDFKDQLGGVSVQIRTRMEPQGELRSYPPFAVAAGQAKADFRGSGRLFRIRFSGNSSPASVRFGVPRFDMVPTGGR